MALVVKNPPVNIRDTEKRAESLGREVPWSRNWQPTPEFLPRKLHGQKNLAGYSPQGHSESDTTE